MKKSHTARLKPKLDENEYRFDRVIPEEYEDCFLYELQRCRLPRLRVSIMEEAQELDETGESAESTFARKLDLQAQLDVLKHYARPWLMLSKAEKTAINGKSPQGAAIESCQPVQLISELRGVDRVLLLGNSGRYEKLEIVVDWAEADTQLADSFLRLVKWMRKRRGKSAFLVEARGHRPWPIEVKLFSLAVWRCYQAGMSYSKIWNLLSALRGKVALGSRNKRMLSMYSRYIGRLVEPLGNR
jgi:hypothetical protein